MMPKAQIKFFIFFCQQKKVFLETLLNNPVLRRQRMKKLISTGGLLFFCFNLLFAQQQSPDQIRLTLNDCLIKALENNFDILVEVLTPEISEFIRRGYREKFLPRLSFGYLNQNTYSLGTWGIEGATINSKSDEYSMSLTQELLTGGELTLSLSNSMTDTTRNYPLVDPSYYSTLRLDFSQPLLKNFGPKINTRDIKKAKNQWDISVYGLKSTVIQKVYEVEEAYWSLVRAVENMKVREYSLEKSKERLKKTREAARIGINTAIDVLSSETDAASGESSVLATKSQVDMLEERLKKVINLHSEEKGLFKSILPLDRPAVAKKEITFDEALKIALEQRPELASKQKEIENSSIDVSYFKNQLLPQLDLRLQLWYPGQSGLRYFYLDDNPLTGQVIGTIEGSRGDSLKDVFNWKYDNWQIRLDLNLPFANFLSRASLARARTEKQQKLLENDRELKSIYYEIVEILKELKNNESSLDASVRYRQLMERKLEAEEERYRLGLIDSDWLFQFQERLVQARTGEIGAIIDYKISVAKLEKILGTSLKAKNLKFRSFDF
jgi:outer membrane protein TolC